MNETATTRCTQWREALTAAAKQADDVGEVAATDNQVWSLADLLRWLFEKQGDQDYDPAVEVKAEWEDGLKLETASEVVDQLKMTEEMADQIAELEEVAAELEDDVAPPRKEKGGWGFWLAVLASMIVLIAVFG